ncbi:hypothetical protein SODALDRAFT_355301 [Sodiomyces alkalinus F11]|uniref:Uncharacterized protein n=1 Tax=Sodiomyces alkalinus (strain CBS 110278 / VKM F-3762 / F11) TaxID=1314773 RepID=A0A3N2Q8Q1_SODAK|nr:hypothetical protein SODALDRAFT_355301 [Sodiomyces alkalinus F11]ROT43106.1 hypothetical protein SODALDRAFT_355301 [Sodiomyces alkalinus F11]
MATYVILGRRSQLRNGRGQISSINGQCANYKVITECTVHEWPEWPDTMGKRRGGQSLKPFFFFVDVRNSSGALNWDRTQTRYHGFATESLSTLTRYISFPCEISRIADNRPRVDKATGDVEEGAGMFEDVLGRVVLKHNGIESKLLKLEITDFETNTHELSLSLSTTDVRCMVRTNALPYPVRRPGCDSTRHGIRSLQGREFGRFRFPPVDSLYPVRGPIETIWVNQWHTLGQVEDHVPPYQDVSLTPSPIPDRRSPRREWQMTGMSHTRPSTIVPVSETVAYQAVGVLDFTSSLPCASDHEGYSTVPPPSVRWTLRRLFTLFRTLQLHNHEAVTPSLGHGQGAPNTTNEAASPSTKKRDAISLLTRPEFDPSLSAEDTLGHLSCMILRTPESPSMVLCTYILQAKSPKRRHFRGSQRTQGTDTTNWLRCNGPLPKLFSSPLPPLTFYDDDGLMVDAAMQLKWRRNHHIDGERLESQVKMKASLSFAVVA